MVWRSFPTGDYTNIMDKVVDKCQDDELMRPRGTEGLSMPVKRGRDIPVRKMRTEGRYSETQEESAFHDEEETRKKRNRRRKM